MKHFGLSFKFLIASVFLLTQLNIKAQNNNNSTQNDSIKIGNVSPKTDTTQEYKALKSAISADTIIPFVADKLEKFSMKIHTSNRILKSTLDLKDQNAKIDSMDVSLDKMQKRMSMPGYKLNLQYTNTSLILQGESQEETENNLKQLTELYTSLTQNNKEIKGILNDPIFQLKGIPDSNLVAQLYDLKSESRALDSSETINIAKLNYLRSRTATLNLRLKDMLSDLRFLQGNRMSTIWNKEEPSFLKLGRDAYKQDQGFAYNVSRAIKVSFRIIGIYMKEKGYLVLLDIFLLAMTYWISYSCKKKLAKSNNEENRTLQPLVFFSRNILACTAFAALCYFYFFFANPPTSLLNLLEIGQILILTYLLVPILHKKERVIWLALAIICIFLCIDNQLLESTIGERWMLLFLQLGLIATLFYTFKNLSQLTGLFSKNNLIKTLLFTVLALAILSLLTNLTGRVTLSKILGFTSIQIVILTVIYRVFSNIVLEFIYLYSEANSNSRFSAFLNYSELRNKYNRILFIVCGIAFFLNITHCLYLYAPIIFTINMVLTHHHTIGAFDFTLYSIFIFILIIWIAGTISSFVRFVLGSENFSNANKRNKIGSMTLLIRLAIWILGFLVAIAAAGIPIDKITIILSALGVGIGFGLQNIANNLVSGVILAFERPIQVGDSIDISGTSGTVSEIGVRSSKLKITGGADVIIPNGDILSQKITNWTLTNRTKQESFPIRIAYGEDLYKVKKIIEEELACSDLILEEPPIAVTVNDFGSNTVLLKAYFWVRDVDNSSSIRSKLMYQVYARLLRENIQLPKDSGSDENS